ncbi:MAG: hypothetical protein AAFP87_21285, partial [Pseudomonadota bacterium]
SCGVENLVKLWDLEGTGSGREPTLLRSLKGHSDWIRCMAKLPHQDWLATCSEDSQVILWDLRAESGSELVRKLGHDNSVFGLAILEDGESLASGDRWGNLKYWKVGKEEEKEKKRRRGRGGRKKRKKKKKKARRKRRGREEEEQKRKRKMRRKRRRRREEKKEEKRKRKKRKRLRSEREQRHSSVEERLVSMVAQDPPELQ